MLSETSQRSLKSAVESFLTWTRFKVSKPAPEDKVALKNKDIFNIVMTPDRIPKFFIPSLDIEHICFQLEPVEDTEDCSQDRRTSTEVAQEPRQSRSKSESHIKKETLCRREQLFIRQTLYSADTSVFFEDLERASNHSDPATRAALSLPHLSKITTPYGFLMLGESPNIRRKESLFFERDSAELRILLSQRKTTTCLPRSPSSPLSDLQVTQQSVGGMKSSATPLKKSRSLSWEPVCKSHPPPPLHPSPLPPQSCKSEAETCPLKCEKKRFQMVIKRHLASVKRMRSTNAAVEKLALQTERTQRKPLPHFCPNSERECLPGWCTSVNSYCTVGLSELWTEARETALLSCLGKCFCCLKKSCSAVLYHSWCNERTD